ncbi:hypothetical protein HXW73_01675 [Halomonas sp. SH5A2]|uniref:hypothetical protein n=1 Tax=Halomonas sp. SH5A2 TaxID=2749040 RepID=UPI001640E158|nr:hypothetical protein [Halomonas sp. SH5A2]QNI01753.1 hypothetical protein HXW73_01675 [Halomonas sp. SH5A2]
MRLTPWIMPFAFAAAMLSAASLASADEHEHEPLDDAALEEQYGIKEGAVKRDEQGRSSEVSEPDSNGGEDQDQAKEEEERGDTEAGTGGTGSAEDAIEEGESEQSAEDEG